MLVRSDPLLSFPKNHTVKGLLFKLSSCSTLSCIYIDFSSRRCIILKHATYSPLLITQIFNVRRVDLYIELEYTNISHILKEIELQCRGGKETHSNNIFLNSMVAEYCNMHGNHPQNFFFFLGFIILEITMSFYAVVAIHVYNI